VNLNVFTTRHGSALVRLSAPCIKLATSGELYGRLADDMDLKCGDIVPDSAANPAKSPDLFEPLDRVTLGEEIASGQLGVCGGVEFVPGKSAR